MTGGGFGGSVVALVPTELVDPLLAQFNGGRTFGRINTFLPQPARSRDRGLGQITD